MKILLLNPAIWIYGGAEKVIVELCNYLIKQHHETTILTTQFIPEVRKELLDTRIIQCKDFVEMSNIYREICEDFDIINIHNHPCELLTFPRKMNTVWICNEPPPEYFQIRNVSFKEIEIVQEHIKKVVVADEMNKNRFKEIYGKKSEIINYGVDYNFFSTEPNFEDVIKISNKIDIKGEDFIITQVGFIHPTKNQLRTIEIFDEYRKINPNAKLVLAGQPILEYLELVRNEVAKRGLLNDVKITGELNREEIRALYSITNVSLLPVHSQGSWLSAFESTCANVLTIVSNELTASEIIYKNGLGIVCNTNEEFIKAIELSREVDLEKPKEWIKENLTWEKFGEKMLEVFENARKS